MKPFNQEQSSARTFRPFDLEEAKAGKPIQMMDGTPCRFIAFVEDADVGQQLIIMNERTHLIITRRSDGLSMTDGSRTIVMAPVVKKYWVNFYSQSGNTKYDPPKFGGVLFLSESAAKRAVAPERATTISFEIEEP